MTGENKATTARPKSGVACEICGLDIHPKRLELVKTPVCVGCMEELEAEGQGTQKHRMSFNVEIKGDEIESIETTIIRKE